MNLSERIAEQRRFNALSDAEADAEYWAKSRGPEIAAYIESHGSTDGWIARARSGRLPAVDNSGAIRAENGGR